MLCKKCGEEIPEDSRFCLSCGTNLENNAKSTKKNKKIIGWIFILGIVFIVINVILGLAGIFDNGSKDNINASNIKQTDANSKEEAKKVTIGGDDRVSVKIVGGFGTTDIYEVEAAKYVEIASAPFNAIPSRMVRTDGSGANGSTREALPPKETLDRMYKFDPADTKRLIKKGYVDYGAHCFVLLDDEGRCTSADGVFRYRRLLHDSGKLIFLEEAKVTKADFKWFYIPCSDGKTFAKTLACPLKYFFDNAVPEIDYTQQLNGIYMEDSYQEFESESGKVLIGWQSLNWPSKYPSN